MSNLAQKLTSNEILNAYTTVSREHLPTPLLQVGTLHEGGVTVEIYGKMDNMSPVGSFKHRGVTNAFEKALSSGELKPGDTVSTASTGNHALAFAYAASHHGLYPIVFIPQDAPEKKKEGIKNYGAEIVLVKGRYVEAAEEAERYSKEKGIFYVSASDNRDLMIGHSTVVTELMKQMSLYSKRPDFLVFPTGSSIFANAGASTADIFDREGRYLVDGFGTRMHIYSAQSENFDVLTRSFHAQRVLEHIDKGSTIADGIAATRVIPEMLELSLEQITDIYAVSEDQIKNAIRWVYNSDALASAMEQDKKLRHEFGDVVDRTNIIEGAAGAAFAAVLDGKIPFEEIARDIHPRRNIVGVVIASGGNIDDKVLEEILSSS